MKRFVSHLIFVLSLVISAHAAHATTYTYSGVSTLTVDGNPVGNPTQTLVIKNTLTNPQTIIATTTLSANNIETDKFVLKNGKVTYYVTTGQVRKGSYTVSTKNKKTTITFKINGSTASNSGKLVISTSAVQFTFILVDKNPKKTTKFLTTATRQ